MDSQNLNPEQPTQFPIPNPDPILPIQPIIQIPPIIQPDMLPEIDNEKSPPDSFFKSKKFYLIVAGFVILLIVGIFSVIYSQNKKTVTNNYDLYTPFPKYVEIPSTTPTLDVVDYGCHSPLAQAGIGPFDMCSYRDQKISITEAQSVLNDISLGYGIVLIPPTLKFSHEENYKGISIKWTDAQPISANTLSWIKSALDILPPYFYQDHPVQAIISASATDLGQSHSPESEGAALYQSGLNIFLTSEYAKGSSTMYVVNKEVLVQGLFHEWVHVVQNYEILQTFTVKYLFIPGNASVVMGMSPFNISYAKAAGWIFTDGDWGYATLGTDNDAQKQTDYGKTKYVEDMAESGSFFMLCQNDKISDARIKWWEQTTGTSRNAYCPSKI